MKRSYSSLLWKTLKEQYRQMGFNQLDDEAFEAVCVARIVEPTSKLDSLWVLMDLGVELFKKITLFRCPSKVVEQRTPVGTIDHHRIASGSLRVSAGFVWF
jgi:hypothetical protein